MSDTVKKTKKSKNIVQSIILGALTALVVLLVREVLNKSKYDKVEEYLLNHYYSAEHLENAMKELLGENADNSENSSKFISENFDNYVFNLIFKDVNKYESDNMSKYNTYLTKAKADKIMDVFEEPGEIVINENDNILYLKIPSFTSGKTYKEIKKSADKIRNYNNFIIDLRDNTGGDIKELIDIMSLFYEKDSVVYIEKSQDKMDKYKSDNNEPYDFEKIVFLCNESTASAAEAMIFNMNSDFDDKVDIIGCTTYGKNFCYAYTQFKDGEMLMFISGIMCNSKGETFSNDGINPEYNVENDNILKIAEQLLTSE